MGTYSVIGKPLTDVDIIKKANGSAIYAADIKLPGMLHGKILRSRYPHARILNINTSKAKRLPGVAITSLHITQLIATIILDESYGVKL